MIIYRQDGNAALEQPILAPSQSEPQPSPQPSPNEQPQTKKAAHRQPKTFVLTRWQKVKILSKILLFTVLAFLLLSRFAVVAQQNLAILSMKNDLKAQQTANADLEAKLSASSGLSNVQEQAEGLNMNFPVGDQVQYVAVTPYEQLAAAKAEQDKTKGQPSIVREIME